MDDPTSPTELPAPPRAERCYRHPDEETLVHCTRCGRPICPRCMIPAPVGHHCPECVAEARREFRQGPGRRIAIANARRVSATNVLLLAIAGAYVVEVVTGGPGALFDGPSIVKLENLGASFAVDSRGAGLIGIATGQYWRLLTSMFLHAGILHIGLNAYALWIFGNVVEKELGRLRFLLIYFVTGIAAGAASYAFGPNSVGVGASGAIFGVFGAFIAYNYRRRDLALAAARLRSAMFLILVNALIAFTVPVIDWRAHAGGLVAGFAAGFAAEGAGTRTTRRAILVLGFAGLLLAAAALVAWKTSWYRSRAALT